MLSVWQTIFNSLRVIWRLISPIRWTFATIGIASSIFSPPMNVSLPFADSQGLLGRLRCASFWVT